MKFYLDENLPVRVAYALDALEGEKGHEVYHTEEAFAKEIKDTDLFPLIKENNGILMTGDLKMLSRKKEHELILKLGITVIFFSLPKGARK